MASGEDCLLVGDGALRYREAFDGLRRSSSSDSGLAYPSASSLVQLAHAQALREEWVNPWELEPLYLRKPDAEINWSTRESAPLTWRRAVPAVDPNPLEVRITPMRRRHLRSVLRIENQVYPRPWSLGLFMSELAHARRDASTSSPRSDRPSSATPGCCSASTTATSPRSRSTRSGTGTRSAPGCCCMLARQCDRGTGPRASPSRCGRATTARRRCTGSSGSRRRHAQGLLRDQRGRHRDVGPRHRHARVRGTAGGHRERHPRSHASVETAASEVVASVDRTDRARCILGIETSCDETAAAVVVGGTDVLLVGGVEPGRPARPVRRRRARDRQPRPRRAAHPGGGPGGRRGGHRATSAIDAVARHRRPGAGRLAARRRQRGQGAGARVGRAVRRR